MLILKTNVPSSDNCLNRIYLRNIKTRKGHHIMELNKAVNKLINLKNMF